MADGMPPNSIQSAIGCGFYCNDTYTTCVFAMVVIHYIEYLYFNENTFQGLIQLVWSANRNHPVKLNATLQLTQDGDLILVDADGISFEKSVSGLNLTEKGNLMLFNQNNATNPIHPKPTINLFYKGINISNLRIEKLSPHFFLKPRRLRMSERDWGVVADLRTLKIDECGHLMVCGKYGICLNGQRSCPDETNNNETITFRQTIYRQPNLGCSLVTPISCNHSREFEELDEFSIDQVPMMHTRFSYEDLKAMTSNFNNKLGEGGFGSVFQGTFGDGTKAGVSEDDMHLLSLFKRKAEENRLVDIVDKYSEEMQLHGVEVVEMMRVVVWCLQRGLPCQWWLRSWRVLLDVENNLDYNFFNPVIPRTTVATCHQEGAVGATSILLFPSVLSGPR
ncbi:hypothetical protein HYC85_014836 [Camellia sinensis]|uniref:Protein kinase domain-containing protein n=1 Tax=Camellia sinensis TaxID=4442 RepID=A0A7J7H7M5_CAMSI|nr:hypothetical protein HYC85_014836 [Camellia sinensis]